MSSFIVDVAASFPTSTGALSSLESLHLHRNHLSGAIPLSLQNGTHFEVLDLRENAFIRDEICHLQYLQILDLFGNNLSGPLSPCISNLTATAIVANFVELLFQNVCRNMTKKMEGKEMSMKLKWFYGSMDLLSEPPDDILVNIISCLPLKETERTDVLSSRLKFCGVLLLVLTLIPQTQLYIQAQGERSSWTKDGDNRIQTDVIYNKFTGHVFQLHLQNPNSVSFR
ncbi:hypothetical protein WN943_014518 [Citrus x changshan-huyou]